MKRWILLQPLLLLLLAFSHSTGFAADMNQCFKRTYLPLFQNLNRYRQSDADRVMSINATCGELAQTEMNAPSSMPSRIGLAIFAKGINQLMFGRAMASFSTLQRTAEGRQYMATLKQIRQNPNPLERIKATYELAAANSGHYDDESRGYKTWTSGLIFGSDRPENLLANNRRNGSVGICREFAALLEWSLSQVSRYAGSKNMALESTDFSIDLIYGYVPGDQGWSNGFAHSWVRVNLPIFKNGRLLDFSHFDLDTTFYPDTFAVLFPRRSGMSFEEHERASRECREITECILNNADI